MRGSITAGTRTILCSGQLGYFKAKKKHQKKGNQKKRSSPSKELGRGDISMGACIRGTLADAKEGKGH